MAWIESHQDIQNHPKMLRLARTMGWDQDQTIGKLHRFWWWCLSYAPSGDLSKKSVEDVAEGIGVPLADAQKCFMAMVDAGWIDSEPFYLVHDWLDYAGRYLRDTKYKRDPKAYKSILRLYGKRGRQSADNPPTVSRKSAVPTNLTNQPNQPTIPTELAGIPGIVQAWGDWEVARREMKKPLTNTARKQQFLFLIEQQDPVAVLRQSIQNQWQGLFELKGNANGKGNGRFGHQGPARKTYTDRDIEESISPSGAA